MRHQSYANLIRLTNLVNSGLQRNLEQLAKRGITPEFIQDLAALKDKAINLNSKQETLKATLKVTTRELEQVQADIEKKLREAIRLIKLEKPQPSWREFGIYDRR